MTTISDEKFDRLITRAMDELPQEYITGLDNIAIVMADEPSEEQVKKMKLDHNHLLLGLYEGIPLTQRGAGYTFVLPDKITLFKHALLRVSPDEAALFAQIKRTLWHEIAHFMVSTTAILTAYSVANSSRFSAKTLTKPLLIWYNQAHTALYVA